MFTITPVSTLLPYHLEKMSFDLQVLGYPHFGGMKLPPHKPVALLLYLACRQEWVSREELATLFWPDTDTSTARHNLRILLHRVKQLSWAEGLEQDAQHLRWRVQTDLQHFRMAIQQENWEEACMVHAAPLLQGFLLQEVPGLDAWCEVEREDLLSQWHSACLRHARALVQQKKHHEAAQVMRTVLQSDPLSETALQHHLEALYLSGQRSEALKAYDQFCQQLQEELGLEPLQETQRLMQLIRTSEPLPEKGTDEPHLPLAIQHPPRLVGRQVEQQQLLQARTRLMLVCGEPGVGKSRLLQESFPDARWLRCREGLQNLPFFPLLEELRASPPLDPGPYRPDLARLMPERYPDPLPPADPLTLKPRLLEALKRALVSEGQPMVVDDLQWADPATLEWMSYVLQTSKVQLVGSYRSSEVSPDLQAALSSWKSSNQLTVVELKDLSEKDILQLLADLTGQQEGPPLFSHWLFQHSGGNAFFALETLKALFQTGTLRIEGTAWHTDLDDTTRDYSELQVPSGVAEVIQRRLRGLPENALRVAQAASVTGTFQEPLLSHMLNLSEWDLMDALDLLEQAGLKKQKRFAHDLIRQTLHTTLSGNRKKMLHHAAASHLQGHADGLLVARHWREAGQPEKAWTLEIQHAEQQIRQGLLQSGLTLLARLCEELPQAHPLRLEALLVRGYHLLLLNIDEADQVLEEALASPGLTPDLHLRALLSRVDNAVYRGDMALAQAHISTAAEKICPQTTPDTLQLRFAHAQLEVLLRSGQFAQTQTLLPEVYQQHGRDTITLSYEAQLLFYQGHYLEAAALFEQMRNQDPMCVYTLTLENDLGVTCWMLGQLPAAEIELQLSLQHWQGSPHVEALSHMHMGFVRLSQGRFTEALQCMDRARQASQVVGSLTFEADILQRLGVIYSHAGRFNEALHHLENAMRLLQQVGDPYRLGMAGSLLSLMQLMVGDVQAACQQLQDTTQVLQKHPSPLGETFRMQTQGMLHLHHGDKGAALECFRLVEVSCRGRPMPEFLALNLLTQASLHSQGAQQATEALQIAVSHGFKRLEWQACTVLGLQEQACEALQFLQANSPDGWF